MAQIARTLTLTTAAGVTARKETYNGREHLVLPVVALVEGVVQAMNAGKPELVRAAEFSRVPAGWNGRPIFLGHPIVNRSPVSGNTPTLLETKAIGTIFNTGIKDNKLVMEAWIDVEKSNLVNKDLLDRVNAGDPIEISVGVFCETDNTTGEYDGKKYNGEWHDIVPDHLALLPEGDTGACSRKMGCGVRAAKGSVMAEKGIFSRILTAFRSAQPTGSMSDVDIRQELMDALNEKEPALKWNGYIVAVYEKYVVYCLFDNEGMDYYTRDYSMDASGEATVADTRLEVEQVISYEPVEAGDLVAAAGKRNSAKDQEKIQAMHDHAVTLGAACANPKAASQDTTAGGSCSCQHGAPKVNNQSEADMKKSELVKFLETATDAQLEALSKAIETPAPAVVPAPVAEPVVASAPKAKTEAEFLADAPAEIRETLEAGLRVGRATKAATIKTLKDSGRCSFSDEALNAKNQDELNQMVALAGITVAASAPVDFSGQALPRVPAAAGSNQAPAPADLNAAIKAARGVK